MNASTPGACIHTSTPGGLGALGRATYARIGEPPADSSTPSPTASLLPRCRERMIPGDEKTRALRGVRLRRRVRAISKKAPAAFARQRDLKEKQNRVATVTPNITTLATL